MYQVGEQKIPLCLECFSKVQALNQQEMDNARMLANLAIDQMNSQFGFLHTIPRMQSSPVPVVIQGVKMQNINVNNSVVGAINTGVMQSVDVTISALNGIGNTAAADAVKGVSEAILGSSDLTATQKNELIECMNVIAKEAATPEATRSNAVGKSLLEKVIQTVSVANDISEVCLKWWPVLQGLFNAGVSAT